jgi:phosphoribosylamine--glycine ligase
MDQIIQPVATGMTDEGMHYRGILYAGLMLTDKGPQVIEFNCRFGDPEAQVILPRLQSDLLSAIYTTTEGGLQNFAMQFAPDSAVTVVIAAKGYPGSYEKGTVIIGAETLEAASGCLVFHAGTAKDKEGQIIANGGRVLCVTALGTSIEQARAKAYQGVAEINWDAGFTRSDIAAD